MSTARYNTFTTNNITCHVIVADYDAVNVQNLGTNIYDAQKFGINGTFYDSSLNRVWQIAATYGGQAVITGGDVNCYPRKTLVCYNVPGSGTPTVGVYHLSQISEMSGVTIRWAIGGVGYYLDKTFTSEQDFITQVNNLETCKDVVGFNTPGFSCYHTAIGYRTSDNKIIMLTTSSNSSAWQVRSILKDYIGCNDAVYLDSNPSTELRARLADGTIKIYPADSNGNPLHKNNTLNYVTVNPTSWL